MKVYKKWWLPTIAALAMTVSLAACSGGSGDNRTGTDEPKGTETGTSGGAISFKYYIPNEPADFLLSSKQWTAIQAAAGAEVEIVDGGPRDSAYSQNLDLLFASGDMPDTLYIRNEQANQYGPEGALIDLLPLINEHAPHITAYFEKNPEYKRQVVTPEGHIYALIFETAPLPSQGWIYRKDWAEQLGVKPPETLDEFTGFLRKLKETNPGGNSYFYPLTSQGYTHLNRGFVQVFDIPSYDDRIDVFNPNFKTFIEYLRMLYDEKLFDPESANGSISEDALKAKLVNGDAGVFFRGLWNAEDNTIAARTLNPDYELTSLAPLKPEIGDKRYYLGGDQYFPHWAMAVTTAAKDPAGVVKFLDFLFSEEGMTLNHWGIEGESYTVENGKKKYLITMEDVLAYKPGSGENNWMVVRPGQYDFPSPMDPEAAISIQTEFMQGLVNNINEFTIPASKYLLSPEDKQRQNDLEAVIGPLQQNWVVAFVTGRKELSEWDTFLKEMEDAGQKEVLDIMKRSLLE